MFAGFYRLQARQPKFRIEPDCTRVCIKVHTEAADLRRRFLGNFQRLLHKPAPQVPPFVILVDAQHDQAHTRDAPWQGTQLQNR